MHPPSDNRLFGRRLSASQIDTPEAKDAARRQRVHFPRTTSVPRDGMSWQLGQVQTKVAMSTRIHGHQKMCLKYLWRRWWAAFPSRLCPSTMRSAHIIVGNQAASIPLALMYKSCSSSRSYRKLFCSARILRFMSLCRLAGNDWDCKSRMT